MTSVWDIRREGMRRSFMVVVVACKGLAGAVQGSVAMSGGGGAKRGAGAGVGYKDQGKAL